MQNHIMIPASPGEVLDKISILQIKLKKINSEEKLANVQHELNELVKAYEQVFGDKDNSQVRHCYQLLKNTNLALWDVEDRIRAPDLEDNKKASLADEVHELNKERADLKYQINDLLGSSIVEEKQYAGE